MEVPSLQFWPVYAVGYYFITHWVKFEIQNYQRVDKKNKTQILVNSVPTFLLIKNRV